MAPSAIMCRVWTRGCGGTSERNTNEYRSVTWILKQHSRYQSLPVRSGYDPVYPALTGGASGLGDQRNGLKVTHGRVQTTWPPQASMVAPIAGPTIPAPQ